MRSEQEREAHRRFVQALQHEHLTCTKSGCGGPMDVVDHTPHSGRIKSYEATCERCHTVEKITGKEEHQPSYMTNPPVHTTIPRSLLSPCRTHDVRLGIASSATTAGDILK